MQSSCDEGSEDAVKIWYCNHYAMPPGAGGAERPVRLAEALQDAGEQVLVVAAGRHHLYREEPDEAPPVGDSLRTEVRGIDFCLLGVARYQGNGPGRLRNMRDFGAGLRRLARQVEEGSEARPDVVIYSSPHPFGIPAAVKVARRLGAAFVLEVRDLWPQSLVEIAGVQRWHPICLWAAYCVRVGHRAASRVIGVLPGVAAAAADAGIETVPGEVAYLPNGAKLQGPETVGENPYASEFAEARKRGKLVVAYTGSLGIANSMEQILDLAGVEAASGRRYHFFLIGSGLKREELQQRIASEGIDFVTLLPAVEKQQIPAVLQDADAAVVVWKKLPLYRYGVSPNKLFDYFAAGVPVLWVGQTTPDPVVEAGAGWSVVPNDPPALHEALQAAASTEANELREMGSRGRDYLRANHDWKRLGARFVELCRDVVAADPQTESRHG